MVAFSKTLPPVLPGNVSEAEEDSCLLDLDEGNGNTKLKPFINC